MKKIIISAILIAATLLSLFCFSPAMAENGNRSEQADFVFVIDSTGSMEPYIRAVKSNLSAFVRELDKKDVDLRIGIIDYKDIHVDGEDSTHIHTDGYGDHWFTDIDKVVDAFNSISVNGGGDTPETPSDAFGYINNDDIWQWRAEASKYVFLLTDADYKYAEINGVSVDVMDRYTNDFRSKGIRTSVVSKLDLEPKYHQLYLLTGGIFLDIDSSDYYKLMLDISDWVINALGDLDMDGIPDEWELNGADIDGDGTIDIDFPAMGADYEVPDIFVEIDWMYKPAKTEKFLWWDRVVEAEISLKPSQAALRTVYEQFRSNNINLHIDAGPDSIDFVTGREWGANSGGNSLEYKDIFPLGPTENSYKYWNDSAIANFDRARWTTFRYCMFITKFNVNEKGGYNSGIAENIPGQFFIVCKLNNDRQIAGTFMHELGHTIGLHHGGDDDDNYKANYLSVMNYLFQFSGLMGTDEINYSRFELPEMLENMLSEQRGFDPDGLTAGTDLGTKIGRKVGDDGMEIAATIERIANTAVDFNGNGHIDDILTDRDLNCDGDSWDNINRSINDWNHITFKGGRLGQRGALFAESDEPVLVPDPDESNPLKPENEFSLQDAIDMGLAENPKPTAPQEEAHGCVYCGKVHSDGTLGRIMSFIHKVLYLVKMLFNR